MFLYAKFLYQGNSMAKSIEIPTSNTHDQFTKIQSTASELKKHLETVLLTKKKSWVTKTAEIWNKLSWWQKILIGIALGTSLLVPGIMAKIAALIASGAIVVAAYGGAGVVLQQHFKIEQEANANVGNIITPLTNALESIIQDLNEVHENFNTQVDNLKQNIQTLNKENVTLAQTASKFETLSTTKEELEKEVAQLHKINETLQNTIREISETMIGDKAQHQEFMNRLDNFLKDKNTSFDQITQRISRAETELETVKNELEQNNQRYTNLLNKHEKLIQRQENCSNLQSRIGIFAENHHFVEEEKSNYKTMLP